MPEKVNITVGGITIGISWQGQPRDLNIPIAYRPFTAGEDPDIRLELHMGLPEFWIGEMIFDSAPVWSMHRNGNDYAIKISHNHPDLKRILFLPADYKTARLYLVGPEGRFLDPFFGPAMELLMINYLSRGHGVIIHACGIDLNGKGLLFAGESGAGKSTIAGLWNQQDGIEVLSDDRTLVRQIDGEFKMFGTPWHGEAKFGSPGGIKLENIYFLRHNPENVIRLLSPPEWVQKFLQCSFPPYWNAGDMEYTLALFEELATSVACQELLFSPDESVLKMIMNYTAEQSKAKKNKGSKNHVGNPQQNHPGIKGR